MRYRELTPGLEVSEIGFGNWTVTTGWWGEYTEQEAIDLHRLAFDRGVTFFDTADGYGDGYAEEVLAKALDGKRDQIVISTKFGYDLESTTERRGQQERPHRTDVPYVRKCLENSLRRLRTDVIDIYQLHNPRMNHVEQDDLWEFLEQAKQEGKVRSYGTALGPRIGWLDEGLAAMDRGRGDAMQMIYNLLEQDPGRDLIAKARDTDTKLIVRVPHSSGMLEGDLTADTVFPENDHRRHRPRSWLVEGVQKVATLDFLTQDMTLAQAALRWVMATREIVSALPNFYNAAQVEEFTADVRDLTQEEMDRVAALYADNFGVEPSGLTEKIGA